MSKFSDRFALAFTFPSLRDRSPGRPRVAIGPRGVRFPRLARCRAGGGGTAPSAERSEKPAGPSPPPRTRPPPKPARGHICPIYTSSRAPRVARRSGFSLIAYGPRMGPRSGGVLRLAV
jgi:hypothetical protein